MTNTETSDVEATTRQTLALADAGSELVRITVNTDAAARAVPEIVERVRRSGSAVPIIGDFHYNGHLLLTRFPECAEALDKYRINPGNVGMGRRRDENFALMIEAAIRHGKPVRIGANWGSLDQKLLARLMDENAGSMHPKSPDDVLREALLRSCLESAESAENLGLPHDRIVLSAKVSSVPALVAVYRELAVRCDYSLHLGLTEAGMGLNGTVSSASALSILLNQGIGDTIRVSITPQPGADRCEEVRVSRSVLQVLGIRYFLPQVTSCPGCGRTTSTFFQELAQQIESRVQASMGEWRGRYPGIEQLKIAVMGCVVNGPGESKHADIGISLPGTGEDPKAPVYLEGRHVETLQGPDIAARFLRILDKYVEERYGDAAETRRA